jgi:hypothetical protein
MENKKKETELKVYDIGKPAEATKMALTLKDFVVKQKLYVPIQGKNYAMVDGWQFAGFLSGMNAVIEETVDLSTDKVIKWKARAHIYDASGKLISRGDAVCSSAEAKKKSFDEYAILSMAQTRAIGKAYRNRIGWIMKLAGYDSTPAEEMHNVGATPAEPDTEIVPEGGEVCAECGKNITSMEASYSKKMFGKKLCRDHQKGAKRK